MNEKIDREEELTEIFEDKFINIKEACKTLQEKSKYTNDVVVKMLNDVANFYIAQGKQILRMSTT